MLGGRRGIPPQRFRVLSQLQKFGTSPYPHTPKGILKGIHPHTPKGILKGIPALTILKPCSNFLESTVGLIGFRKARVTFDGCLQGLASFAMALEAYGGGGGLRA